MAYFARERLLRLILAGLIYSGAIILFWSGTTYFELHSRLNTHVSKDFQYKVDALTFKEIAKSWLDERPSLELGNNHDFIAYFRSQEPDSVWVHRLNANGELLDPWGRPYIIAISKTAVIFTCISKELNSGPE